MSTEIKNFEELITPTLEDGQKFVSYEFKSLLPPGENYGSVMLQIQVKILNAKGEEEIIHCVGKTVPPSEFLWSLFNTKVTFKKEIAVYSIIVPGVNEFGKEKGIDNILHFFAKSLGARISLDRQSDVVDTDAFLVLENLKVQGFEIGNRLTGFDLETSKLLLDDLATMHAAVIAYRLANPLDFKTKMEPYLSKDYVFEVKDDFIDEFVESVKDSLKNKPNCVPHLPKIDQAIRNMKYFNANPPQGKDQYKTLIHNDFWVNNTMLKYKDGKAVDNKMVDFQVMEYASLAMDVIFFLYSSVHLSILETGTDELFKFYYEKFIEKLVTLQCDVSTYSYEDMMEEFALIARDAEFSHILYMLAPILTIKGNERDLADLKLADIFTEKSVLHENYYKRMEFVLLDFVKRAWI